MTGFPARWHGFANKGQLKDGYDADVVIFDPETVAPGPTKTAPSLAFTPAVSLQISNLF